MNPVSYSLASSAVTTTIRDEEKTNKCMHMQYYASRNHTDTLRVLILTTINLQVIKNILTKMQEIKGWYIYRKSMETRF